MAGSPLFAARANPPTVHPKSRFAQELVIMIMAISREEIDDLRQKGASLIEVLPAGEYKDAHLPGAISLPLKHITRERMDEFARDLPLVMYCYDNQ
jgi:hypothetical protein